MRSTNTLVSEIVNWDKRNVHELKNNLEELRKKVYPYCISEYVELSFLNTENLGPLTGRETYPIWAVDKNRNCLVGDTLDLIESEKAILNS